MQLKPLTIGAGLAVLLAPVAFPAPAGMSDLSWHASGLAVTMALWWLTEALPLAATALLPLAVAPIMGLTDLDDTARSYSDPLVVLFLGGFLIAKAIEKSGLHRRLAGSLLRHAGTSPHRVLGALMLCTAFLSLWISNTASAMVVAPIAAAIVTSQDDQPSFGTALMLGVAFSATIGGMGSLIGTPPNAIFASYVSTTYAVDIGFAQWAMVGVPVALILLVVTWLFLAWVTPGLEARELVLSHHPQDTPANSAERRVAVVASLTAAAWLSRPLIIRLFPEIAITDAGIAMIAAIALFIVPDGKGKRLLDWDTAALLRWDVLILFGGGLALADILQSSGLAELLGGSVQAISHWPEFAVLLVIAGFIVYLGELASNTAMAAIFLPIAGVVATNFGVDPIAFLIPIALAASVGFMLPVATPPNAIVFANPAVTRANMLRAGAPLDLIALVITVSVSSLLGKALFG
ncbi:Sodium-dependent dicarboxylate transporter SdcS (plasmid) [Pseudoseohaeicola sp. NH-UV-7]|uniref:SLC13 family permease n=1 Tax=unclassified Sulfitobacter TaxID=196795 RepID=UPI000E0BD698|nr:SLC13 family permease [Sulfitobacter sp. JL08]AXI53854.1 anion transporter [Sulfitobacter sp. JL08]